MFDDRSFSSTSFDSRSWFGIGALVGAAIDGLIRARRRLRR
jgi:hypothetical protein